MTERPRVHVEAIDLHGEAPVAVSDSLTDLVFGIDFTQPAEDIAKSLQEVFQEAIDTGRWHRRGTCDQQHAQNRAAPHPQSDPA
ncbi:hypothetical protein [Streptomyces sp. DH12]|uniref:hypothetical protein n=1 Tax=Streptomyces sp. DH12 TaxID=2857010 RepID=UPI001E5A7B1F|nr:hypothetical protein [Streptomyces sp. DH12]